jgi:hypothetical protein
MATKYKISCGSKFIARRTTMNAIRVRKKINSETIHLPELRPLIGKTVEIIVREEPAAPAGTEKDWEAWFASAGEDRIDSELYKQYREFDRQRHPRHL